MGYKDSMIDHLELQIIKNCNFRKKYQDHNDEKYP